VGYLKSGSHLRKVIDALCCRCNEISVCGNPLVKPAIDSHCYQQPGE
jgi:hypothetical protein